MEIETVSRRTASLTMRPPEFTASSGDTVSTEPIEFVGDRAVFKPERMLVDRSYPFEFLGARMVAVKRADESIDFYHLP